MPVLRDAEYVIHIAGVTKAKSDLDYRIGNVETTRSLLSACLSSRRLKKFCFISSLTASGPSLNGIPKTEEDENAPITSYGRSKLEAESVCLQYSSQIPIVILRPPAVYGPRDKDILELFRWINYRIVPHLGSWGKNLSIINARDLAEGIVATTISDSTVGQTYFISNREVQTYTSLTKLASSILRKKPLHIQIPSFLVYAVAGITEGIYSLSKKTPVLNLDKVRDLITTDWTCSSRKLFEHIGFEPKISVEEGFKETVEWYQSQRWL